MDIKYRSDRGIPLITQFVYEEMDEDFKGMLTVEDYNKWYNMFIIRPDGTVEKIHDTVSKDKEGIGWINHAIVPYAFHETAITLGLEYDDDTFAAVCKMFVEDYLEDWSKLYKYLPMDKEGLVAMGKLCRCGNPISKSFVGVCDDCLNKTIESLREFNKASDMEEDLDDIREMSDKEKLRRAYEQGLITDEMEQEFIKGGDLTDREKIEIVSNIMSIDYIRQQSQEEPKNEILYTKIVLPMNTRDKKIFKALVDDTPDILGGSSENPLYWMIGRNESLNNNYYSIQCVDSVDIPIDIEWSFSVISDSIDEIISEVFKGTMWNRIRENDNHPLFGNIKF